MNGTVCGTGVQMLWCPSDGTINGLRIYSSCFGWDCEYIGMTYTDYAGMVGTYYSNDRWTTATELPLYNGMYPDVGTPLSVGCGASNCGWTRSPTKIASILDGTSNTIAFAECAHGKFSQFGPLGITTWVTPLIAPNPPLVLAATVNGVPSSAPTIVSTAPSALAESSWASG